MKLIDNDNNIFYEGSKEQCLRLHKIIYANPEDVREEDEVQFGQAIYKTFVGDIRIQLDLEFREIDSWNRPTFKALDYDVIIGSTDILFDYNEVNNCKEYFRNNPEGLVIFGNGSYTDEDPLGTRIGNKFKINIL